MKELFCAIQPRVLKEKVACLIAQRRQRSLILLKTEQVPLAFREPSIERGYREPKCTAFDCVHSAFTPFNNETINFWTHFIPFWVLLYVFVHSLLDVYFKADPYSYPYMAYLATCTLWPLASALAHLFSIMSVHHRHVCFIGDYIALSWYSFGSSTVYHAYSFDRSFMTSAYYELYPFASLAAAVFCTLTAIYTRLMPKGRHFWVRKAVRSIGFLLPYLIVNGPLLQRIYNHRGDEEDALPIAIHYHKLQFVSTFFAFMLYNTHWPERMWPGRFDFVGQSHQIFHCLGVLSTFLQMSACRMDMTARRSFIQDAHSSSFIRRLGRLDLLMVMTVLLVNLCLAVIIVRRLPTYNDHHSIRESGDSTDDRVIEAKLKKA